MTRTNYRLHHRLAVLVLAVGGGALLLGGCAILEKTGIYTATVGSGAYTDLDGRTLLPVLTGKEKSHRSAVFGTHTGNENGGPGIANHCPARTIRTETHRYILNLSPDTTFTTHITGRLTPSARRISRWRTP